MKDLILDKINQLISDAKKDRDISAEARTEVVCYLAELKMFVQHQTL